MISIKKTITNVIYSGNKKSYDFFNKISENLNFSGLRVLEIGCGLDGYSKHFVDKNNSYFVCDISDEAIKIQKQEKNFLDKYRISSN